MSVVNPLVSNEPPLIQSKRPTGVILGALGLGRTRIGLGLVLIIAAIAIFGPLIAPHGPAEGVRVGTGAGVNLRAALTDVRCAARDNSGFRTR